MKKTLLLLLLILAYTFISHSQNVGINPTGAAPDASAILDLSATDKGFLITRADIASIATPAFGLMTLAPIDSPNSVINSWTQSLVITLNLCYEFTSKKMESKRKGRNSSLC